MVDFPGTDASEAGGEDVGRPFVTKHDCLALLEAVLLHRFGKFGTHRFLGPPDTIYTDRFAEFLHHFLATVVANDYDFNASLFAIFDPILELVGGFFFGMEAEGIVEVTEQKLHVLVL